MEASEWEARVAYMDGFADRLRDSGEFVAGTALAMDGEWVRYDGDGRPPLTDEDVHAGRFRGHGALESAHRRIERCVERPSPHLSSSLSALRRRGENPEIAPWAFGLVYGSFLVRGVALAWLAIAY